MFWLNCQRLAIYVLHQPFLAHSVTSPSHVRSYSAIQNVPNSGFTFSKSGLILQCGRNALNSSKPFGSFIQLHDFFYRFDFFRGFRSHSLKCIHFFWEFWEISVNSRWHFIIIIIVKMVKCEKVKEVLPFPTLNFSTLLEAVNHYSLSLFSFDFSHLSISFTLLEAGNHYSLSLLKINVKIIVNRTVTNENEWWRINEWQ